MQQYLAEFLSVSEHLDRDFLKEKLNVFERRFSTYSDAFNALLDELKKKASIIKEDDKNSGWAVNDVQIRNVLLSIFRCYLREISYSSNHNFPYFNRFLSDLEQQLIEVVSRPHIFSLSVLLLIARPT